MNVDKKSNQKKLMSPNTNNSNMPKKSLPVLLIAGIVLVLIIGIGAFAYNNNQVAEQKKKDDETAMMMKKEEDAKMMKKDAMMKKDETDKMMKSENSAMMKSDDSMMKKDGDTMMSKVGVYKNYDASELSQAKDGHHVVLFFNASWCPDCKATVKDIEANKDKLDPKLHLLSVDYDSNVALRQKYGVTSQHTFVDVDSSGNLIKKQSGLGTVDKINNFIK
jgi:thiol-disulfide isomerase/thioredoxin